LATLIGKIGVAVPSGPRKLVTEEKNAILMSLLEMPGPLSGRAFGSSYGIVMNMENREQGVDSLQTA